jgi:hypothetical protein
VVLLALTVLVSRLGFIAVNNLLYSVGGNLRRRLRNWSYDTSDRLAKDIFYRVGGFLRRVRVNLKLNRYDDLVVVSHS